MKALFITNCGCTQMLEVPEFCYEYYLPLLVFDTIPKKRRFKFDMFQMIATVKVAIFREVSE